MESNQVSNPVAREEDVCSSKEGDSSPETKKPLNHAVVRPSGGLARAAAAWPQISHSSSVFTRQSVTNNTKVWEFLKVNLVSSTRVNKPNEEGNRG